MNTNKQKISVVILNWARPQYLKEKIIPALEESDLVDEIILSHGREDTFFEYNSSQCSVVSRHDYKEINSTYGLSRRFIAGQQAGNDLILILDDDVLVKQDTIGDLYKRYQEKPDRIHGLWGRKADYWNNFIVKDVYGDVLIVVTKCMLIPKRLCFDFFNYVPLVEDIVKHSVPYWNGEDIFMALVSIKVFGNLPIAHDLIAEELPIGKESISHRLLEHVTYRRSLFKKSLEKLNLEKYLSGNKLGIFDWYSLSQNFIFGLYRLIVRKN